MDLIIFVQENFCIIKFGPTNPPGVLWVPISGPAHGMFSKLNGPSPLGSRGHSHTSFRNGRFDERQSSFHIDVGGSYMRGPLKTDQV